MQTIWNQVAHGDVIEYAGAQDLSFLYASGFVDEEHYTLEQWVYAFDDSKQDDGSYRVTQEQWLAKEKFHYNGPIRKPFDPLLIPEQDYSEAELKNLFHQCIVPSSQLSEDRIAVFLRDYEERGLLQNNKLTMTSELKKELNTLITHFPSPRHVLEVNVARLKAGEQTPSGAEGDKATATAAAHQASHAEKD